MWLLFLLFACGPELATPPEFDLAPVSASVYTVARGDTVARIAAAHGVSVADVVGWNGIDPDRIEVGQALILWVPAPTRGAPAPSRRKSSSKGELVVAPAPEPPRAAGLLGFLGDGADGPDLSALAAGLTARSGAPSSSGLGDRSGMAALAVDARSAAPVREVNSFTPVSAGPRWGSAPVRAPSLAAPPPRRCLAGPSGAALGDEGAVGTRGLSSAQAKASLQPMLRHVAACVPGGTVGGFTLQVELTVGCDGRVSEIEIVEAAGAPEAVQRCLSAVLGATAFPAHDREGGVVMRYPIRLDG